MRTWLTVIGLLLLLTGLWLWSSWRAWRGQPDDMLPVGERIDRTTETARARYDFRLPVRARRRAEEAEAARRRIAVERAGERRADVVTLPRRRA